MTLGEKIHSLRISRNMTMDDLAREIGVQRSAVNKYEKGMVVNLKRSTISSLCRVFNVPSSYLLDDDPTELSSDEHHLIAAYRAAEPVIREAALTMLENSAAANAPKKDTSSGQTA